MAGSAHRDQVIRMIAFAISPFVDMMYVHLDGARCWLFTEHTLVAIPSLDEFADGLPAFAAITIPTAFPMRRLVASEPISRIVPASSPSVFVKYLFTEFRRRVEFRMIAAILTIAVHIAKFAVCMAALTFIYFATVGADYFNLVFPILCGDLGTQANGAFSGAKIAGLLFAAWQALLVYSSRYRFLAATRIARNDYVTAGIAPFLFSFGKGIAADCASLPAGHLTPSGCVWLRVWIQAGHTARSAVLVSG